MSSIPRMRIRPTPHCGFSRHPPGFDKQHEALSERDLHIVLAGSIRYRWQGGSTTARVGSLVALPLGCRFRESDGPTRTGVELAVIHHTARSTPPWTQTFHVHRPRASERDDLIAIGRVIAQTAEDWKHGDAMAEQELAGLVQAMVVRWYRLTTPTHTDEDSWSAALLQRIDETLGDPDCSVTTLADWVHLSRAHFSRRFTETVGISPARYLERRRVRRAKHLLAHGETVAATALACGYRDAFHFSRAFKRVTGEAPSYWRNRSQ